MQETLTFDDVLIKPQFSEVASRKEVDLSTTIHSGTAESKFTLPLISANMDTVTGVEMAVAMLKAGAYACLHRFWTIDENVAAFKAVVDQTGGVQPFVSVGLGVHEFDRAAKLYDAGAEFFVLDVAHGAQMSVVRQYSALKKLHPTTFIMVGNFATGDSVKAFCAALGYEPDAIKVGVGPGSACTTRIKTGCGVPQLSAIIECSAAVTKSIIVADGGCRTPGDVAKALAAGARIVMLGGMLAGTDETPGKVVIETKCVSSDIGTYEFPTGRKYKKYRGSASSESYRDQGKDQAYITAEGESFTVDHKGPVANILSDISGGIRSAFTYVGATNLTEFQQKAEFVRISSNAVVENGAHGKRS